MKGFGFILFILALSQLSQAQSDMVFLTTGDTLKGEIDILLPSDYVEEISFKNDEGKRKWKSFQLHGFRKDDETYKTIKYGEKYRFMKQVIDGYLGLYLFRAGNSYDFGTRYLYKITNEGMEVPNITFKKAVTRFVEECPSVEQGVISKKYKGSNVEELVNAFNDCLTDTPKAAAQKAETKEEVIKDSKELDAIRSLSKKLESENINEELATLIQDITDKLAKGEKVPGYLKSALAENTEEYKSVKKDVKKLLDLLQ